MNCRLSRLPAPRSAISQVSALKPAAIRRIVNAPPAGTSTVKAADSSDSIGSATNTRPLGY